MNPKSFWDYFKEMEPHFDIRYVPGVGIVSGEYFHTVLAKTGCPKCGRQPHPGYDLLLCVCDEEGVSRWQPINPYR